MIKKIQLYLAIILSFCALVGTGWKLNDHWCQAEEFVVVSEKIEQVDKKVGLVQMRLEQKIIQDSLDSAIQGQWKLEDRYGYNISEYPEDAKNLYRRYKQIEETSQKDLETIRSNMK